MLNNPHAQPPLPSDWEVRPTYPVQTVPYFLAPLWDAEYKPAKERRNAAKQIAAAMDETEQAAMSARKVTRELRAKLKRARGAKGLLQDLEQEVRVFVEEWDRKQRELEQEGLIDVDSSEDDEIVFVGRNATMSDDRSADSRLKTLKKDKLIFESLVDDHGASFGYGYKVVLSDDVLTCPSRYLVHAIAQYYGLKTWSVTTGDPARREAYVGLEGMVTTRPILPQPLWLVV